MTEDFVKVKRLVKKLSTTELELIIMDCLYLMKASIYHDVIRSVDIMNSKGTKKWLKKNTPKNR